MQVASDISFARFVYPFVFTGEEQLGQIATCLEKQGWSKLLFPEGDLLPHVRDYLNPRGDSEATAYLLTLSREALAQKSHALLREGIQTEPPAEDRLY